MSMVCKVFRTCGGAGGLSVASRGRSRRSWSLVSKIENRSPSLVSQVVVAAGDAFDEPVAAQSGQVVAGLIHAVGGAAEQPGHQGAQALVGDAGDGEHRGAQGAGQGLDPRVAEP